MKIAKEYEGHWNIISQEDKVIGSIQLSNHWGRGSHKTLYVGEEAIQKDIGKVANQAEALEKLKTFFVENRKEIKKVEKLIEELRIGISQVSHEICISTLQKEKDRLHEALEKLKSYDLI